MRIQRSRPSNDAFQNTNAKALIRHQSLSRMGSSSMVSWSSPCVTTWSCVVHGLIPTRISSRRSSTSTELRGHVTRPQPGAHWRLMLVVTKEGAKGERRVKTTAKTQATTRRTLGRDNEMLVLRPQEVRVLEACSRQDQVDFGRWPTQHH